MKRAAARIPMPRPQRRAADGAWRTRLNQALQAHQKGDLDTAERLYKKVLGQEIAQPDAMHYLGVLCHQRGRSDEAVELIRAALEATPNHPDAHNNLGNVLKESGRLAEAEASYRRALTCSPDHHNARVNLAVVLEAQNRLDEAFATYQAALERAPHHAHAHWMLGRVLCDHAECVEDMERAVQCFRRAFELDGRNLAVLQHLAMTLYALKRKDEAREVYRDWLSRDPDNPVPRHMLAACGGAPAPSRAGNAYVRDTFDRFASSFDQQLLEYLDYRAPQVLVDAFKRVLPKATDTLDVLDAGCGTGLCGPLLRPYARRLVGVDLSGGMLEKARQRGDYDELAEAEITAYLQQHAGSYDAIASADTLVYFGDLAPVFAAAFAALRPGGWFGFSLEANQGEGIELCASGRYRHARRYVEDALHAAGYVDVRIAADSLRKEAGQPVASWVVLARRVPDGEVANMASKCMGNPQE
jgi:predicted TPR repeat methyltransferase